jgi:hypothetical protein
MLEFTRSTITITANQSSEMVGNLLKASSTEMLAINSNTEYSVEDTGIKLQITVKRESNKLVEFVATCYATTEDQNKHCGTVVIRDGFVIPTLRLDLSIDEAERITRLARQAYEEVIV